MSINVSINEQTMIYHKIGYYVPIQYTKQLINDQPNCIGFEVIMPHLFKKQSQCITYCDSTIENSQDDETISIKCFGDCRVFRYEERCDYKGAA